MSATVHHLLPQSFCKTCSSL